MAYTPEIQKKREMLWELIDKKKKDDPSLYLLKNAMIDHLLDEWKNEQKLWKRFKSFLVKTFCKSLDELKETSKKIIECNTISELNNLQSSILNWVNKPSNNINTPETIIAQDTDNCEHRSIDQFNVIVSRKYYEMYQKLKLSPWNEKPNLAPFACAMKWYEKLKWTLNNSKYLTVIDFTKSRKDNRFYVINMDTLTVVHTTKVWHWHNSVDTDHPRNPEKPGEEENRAMKFTNQPGSEQSSLWFLTTSTKREPNHNPNYKREWLRMSWLEWWINGNNNAASRWIFMHRGQNNWSLYSQWCFVIPNEITEDVLNDVIWWSLLFAYAKSKNYFNNSQYFDKAPNWDILIT